MATKSRTHLILISILIVSLSLVVWTGGHDVHRVGSQASTLIVDQHCGLLTCLSSLVVLSVSLAALTPVGPAYVQMPLAAASIALHRLDPPPRALI
jgi:hypothetical protein